MVLICAIFKLINIEYNNSTHTFYMLRVKANIISEGGRFIHLGSEFLDGLVLFLVEIGFYERNIEKSRFHTAVTLRIF